MPNLYWTMPKQGDQKVLARGQVTWPPSAFDAAAGFATVGRHEDGAADAEAGVHDLVFKTRSELAGRHGVRAVAVAQQRVHLCAERGAVELERFFAAAAEEEVGLDLGGGHGSGIVLVCRNQSRR